MRILQMAFLALTLGCACFAQDAAPTPSKTVPHLVRFAGQVKGSSGTVGITFTLHKSQNDNSPLWSETQNVKLDAEGRYNILLGSTKADGIPSELFTSGQAQWLAVRVEGQSEQARVLLVSVPYALKAGEAETFAGRPLSAFVLSGNTTGKGSDGLTYFNTSDGAINNATSGTANYIGVFTNSTDLGNSIIFQSGTKLGVNNAKPNATLHVTALSGTASIFEGYSGDAGTAPGTPFIMRGARGTPAAPAALANNDILGGIIAGGYDGTAMTTTRAGIIGRAGGAWTSSSSPAYLQFFVTNTNTAAAIEAMRIAPSGSVGIGTASPLSTLDVNGTARFRGLATFATGQTFPGTQLRVTGTCAAGNYVRAINADGSVTCGLDVGGGSVSSVTATSGSGLSVANPNTTPAISTDFTVIAKVQSCPSGQVIQSVGANGTATCVSALSALPSGFSILGSSPTPPAGYTVQGFVNVGNGYWNSGAGLNAARSEFAYGVVGNKIYTFGGFDGAGFTNNIQVYDSSAGSPAWAAVTGTTGTFTAASGPSGAVSTKVIATGGIYVFGGNTGTGIVATSQVYNPAANSWTAIADLPKNLAETCTITDALGNIYIFGGNSDADVNGSSAAYRYNPSANTYATLTPMPIGTFDSGCALYNNKVYIFGGAGSTLYVNNTQIYDIATNTWGSGAAVPMAPELTAGTSAVTVGSQIYVMGGNFANPSNQVSVYDPATNTWISGPPSLTVRYYGGATYLNNIVYFFGGRSPNSSTVTANMDVLNPAKIQWLYTKN